MKTTPSGLQYEDTVAGTGKRAEAGQPVTVHYTGWLYDDGVKGAQVRFEQGPQRPVRVRPRRRHGHPGLGRRRAGHAGRRHARARRSRPSSATARAAPAA